MNEPGGMSTGEVGGILAVVTPLLLAIGAGVQWLFRFRATAARTRTAKLDAWHKELAEREEKFEAARARFEEKVESRLQRLERENYALRQAFNLVRPRLHQLSPTDPTLALADQILAQAFPIEPEVPPDIRETLDKIK